MLGLAIVRPMFERLFECLGGLNTVVGCNTRFSRIDCFCLLISNGWFAVFI